MTDDYDTRARAEALTFLFRTMISFDLRQPTLWDRVKQFVLPIREVSVTHEFSAGRHAVTDQYHNPLWLFKLSRGAWYDYGPAPSYDFSED